MAKIVDLDHKWALEIGRTFVAFGSIEHTVLALMAVVPKDSITGAARHMKLGQRLSLLLEMLTDRPRAEGAQLMEALKEIKSITGKRNLVAHNPLMLHLYADADGDTIWKEAIQHSTNPKEEISFAQLVALRERSEALAHELLVAKLEYVRSGYGRSVEAMLPPN